MACTGSVTIPRAAFAKTCAVAEAKHAGCPQAPLAAVGSSRSVFLSGGKVAGVASTSGRLQFGSKLMVQCRTPQERQRQKNMEQRRGQFQMPKLNKDDANFMIFCKPTGGALWYALSMVTGGTTAKALVEARKNDFGKMLNSDNTLTRNMAQVIYKDEDQLANLARNIPAMKKATGFEWGYKIVNNNNPKASMKPTNITPIPSQQELKETETPGEKIGKAVTGIRAQWDKFQQSRGN
eukprot:CAMPEP_0197866756 /NCGR_PEP_ID=MMETSP1438-20131217/44385_1 /TAXON_ID=1461541 /ORGANISM="Pterosperma sp., Strain CCMP1384" /LENGTH=236 /DNA_ID=CAMNT_0043485345 /DNA_START=60 /DNA_END=770 /DNA_ORIENTATION=-